VRQPRHEEHRDQRRVRPVPPHALKDGKGWLRRLALQQVDVPFDNRFLPPTLMPRSKATYKFIQTS
jgi:hypothetical protein